MHFHPKEMSRFASDRPPLANRAGRRGWFYHAETLRPIASLYFILPILLVYELGVLWFGDVSIRNGIDVWFGNLLAHAGADGLLLLPLITLVILLVMHHLRGDQWSVNPLVLFGMIAESIGLALIIWCAAKAQQLYLLQFSDSTLNSLALLIGGDDQTLESKSLHRNLISFCGAGLYEELAFRLLLLPGLILVLCRAGLKKSWSVVLGLLIISVAFASAHYEFLNPAGVPFELPGFVARALASVFFCLVFLFRGFGIAVGVHVAYDVMTLL